MIFHVIWWLRFEFVVSSCLCFFEFSRQKSENMTEKVRQYDTFYLPYFCLLFVVFSLFRIVIFWLFCIFAFRLRMRILIRTMLGGVNDIDWTGVPMHLYKWNAKMRQWENTKKRNCENTKGQFDFVFSLFRQEEANTRQM